VRAYPQEKGFPFRAPALELTDPVNMYAYWLLYANELEQWVNVNYPVTRDG
jgi:hypothetical protein